jgi:uncharacterized protein YeaO (DUF488 family)
VIRLKRAYDPRATSDGYRVLVDRLWPRGLRKEDAHLDAWLKDIAPSDALRKWFGHDPKRYREFEERYRSELETAAARALLDELAKRAARGTVTLVYSAHDEEHNNARVLATELEHRYQQARPRRKPPARAARRNRDVERTPPTTKGRRKTTSTLARSSQRRADTGPRG